MTELENQIIETWNIHHRITLFMLENISDEALAATLSKRGGRNIARQLAHVHEVRVSRLESFAKKNNVTLIRFVSDYSPSKSELKEALIQSGELIAKYIQYSLDNGGVVSNFRRGVVPMIGYFISHEAHHRGSILLTMKQSGFKLSDELRLYIWDWNKI